MSTSSFTCACLVRITANCPSDHVNNTESELRDDRGKRNIIIAALIIVAVPLLAWAAGLFAVSSEGDVDLPQVSVDGGNLPDLDVDAANVNLTTDQTRVEVPDLDVDVGTTNETVTTPEIDVEPANAAAE